MNAYGPDEVVITTGTGATVWAKWTVFATGYEVVEVLKRDVVDLHSSFAFVSEPLESLPGWWEKCLIWETARPYSYMRTTEDGRAIMGGGDVNYRTPLVGTPP